MTHKDMNSTAATISFSLDLCFFWNLSSSKYSDQRLKSQGKIFSVVFFAYQQIYVHLKSVSWIIATKSTVECNLNNQEK